MKQTKRIIIFAIILVILLSNTISYGATTMTEWGFPRTREIYIKEPIEGQKPHQLNPEYRGYYELDIGGSAGGAEIYGILKDGKIEGTTDDYTFTIMKSAYNTHYSMKGRMNPQPGSIEVDGVARSYYIPYKHDYVFKYDNKTREGRFPVWYMKSLDVDSRVPIDSVKSELEEMERKIYDIEYLAKKIKAQGEPKKAGGYHPTHALLLEEYAKDYRKIFWGTANYIYYTAEQITESTKVLDKVVEWIENNRIQPMEILDFKVGEYSGIINRDEKKIDVYLSSGYEIKESDIKIQLPDWIIARKRPGELKLGSSIKYFVKPVDALYENFPQDVLAYDIYQDWTINFIEKIEEKRVQLNSLFYIDSNGEKIYGQINEDRISLNISNEIRDKEIPVNIYYFGKKLFKVEDGNEEELSDNTLLPLHKDIELKIVGDEGNTRNYSLYIKSEKNKENNILDFHIDGIKTEIDNDLKIITLYPKYSDDISELKPSIITSYKAKVEPASQITQNFEEIKEYTVASESGEAQKYVIKVERGEPSSEKEVKSFRIGTIEGKIEGNTIKILLPSNINLKEVQPTIEISEGAKILPASGEKVNLSNKELNYRVTAENGDIQEYKLIADMEEIEIPGVDQELLKELKRIRDGIYERYRNSSALTDDWDWMNIGFYEGVNNGIEPDGIRKGIEDLPKKYDMYGQIGKLDHFKMTDLDRFTMSATAMGIDVSNLSKYTTPDKPFKFKNGRVVNNMIEEIYSKETVGGINGAAFSLIALDMGNYTLPDGANYTRENILKELLELPLDQGFDVDMVGMVIQSLYPYKDHPVYGDRVREHIDYGMDLILGQVPAKYVHPMKDDFTFESWGTVNSESASQVICALASLGIDPHTNYRFSDSKKSLITQWINKFSTFEKNGFGHTNKEYNHMATYQGMYALQWYINFLENGGAGHPYSLYHDVPFDLRREMSSDAEITFFELLGKQGEIDHKKGIIKVIIPNITSDTKLITEPIIKIGDGATINPEIGRIEDFRDDVIYTVTSEDGKTKKEYRIKVEKKEGLLSGEREIEEIIEIGRFSSLTPTIDKQNRRISIVLPSDIKQSELSSMIIDLKHSSGATISPDLSKPRDYTKDVIYTITAEDGQQSDYIIKVSIEEVDKYEFTKFILRGVEGEIDTINNEININLPYGAYVESIRTNEMEYEPSEGVSPTPGLPVVKAFKDENKYTLDPHDKSENSVEYNVKINYVESKGNSEITKFTIGDCNGEIEGKTITLKIPKGMTEKKFIESLRDKEPKIKLSEETKTIDPMPRNENNSLKYDSGNKVYKDDFLKDYVLTDSEGKVNLYTVKFEGGGTGTNPGDSDNPDDPDDPNGSKDKGIEILTFSVNGIKATVDNGNGRIFLEIPFETENFIVFPVVTLSEDTSISPDLYKPIDLRKTNIFTLRKGDIYKQYILMVRKAEPKPATLLWRYMEEDLNIPYYQRVD